MRLWVVDAFAEEAFQGNPAAVMPLDQWLDDDLLQAIAAENNLSETAFLVPTRQRGRYELRWFTPTTEVTLCGHATLAAGAVLLDEVESGLDFVVFETQSGRIVVARDGGGQFSIDLPRKQRAFWEPPKDLSAAIGGARIVEGFTGHYANLVLEDESAVRRASPDLAEISRLVRGPRAGCLAITAWADEGAPYDFVMRFFGPGVGIAEDPVTGSSFADIGPYWSDRLAKPEVTGFQASKRGGFVKCAPSLASVELSGGVHVFSRGAVNLSRLGSNRAAAAKAAQKIAPAAPKPPQNEGGFRLDGLTLPAAAFSSAPSEPAAPEPAPAPSLTVLPMGGEAAPPPILSAQADPVQAPLYATILAMPPPPLSLHTHDVVVIGSARIAVEKVQVQAGRPAVRAAPLIAFPENPANDPEPIALIYETAAKPLAPKPALQSAAKSYGLSARTRLQRGGDMHWGGEANLE